MAWFSFPRPNAPETKQISFALLEDYDRGEDLHGAALDFAAMNQLQIRTWRGSFGWDDYEAASGRYDFKWLHQFVELAEKNGIFLRPYIAYTPEWAAKGGTDDQVWNDPPRDSRKWRDFVYRLVSELRRHRNVLSYEIYNEENVKLWWDGTAMEYNQTLAQGAAAVRRANPAVQILFGGMVWPDTDWIEEACSVHGNRNSFDILPFHAYPETWTAKDVDVENYLAGYSGEFLRTVDEECGPKPIWINETGFATSPGKSELEQANWWARAIATFGAAPRVEHIGIYEIKDAPKDKPVIGDEPNYYLGLLRRDRTPKLALRTVGALVDLLNAKELTIADAEAAVAVRGGAAGRLYHHLFVRSDGRQILFLWDKTKSPTLRIALRRPGSSAIEIGLDGTRRPYSSFDGKSLQDVALSPGMVRIFEIN
jgi:polysaccharide biosynthesis protein PslG